MKNIQVIDGASNATFSLFQATDDEFDLIFPNEGQDMEFAEELTSRIDAAAGNKLEAAMANLWKRPIQKSAAMGIHGTLFYDWATRRQNYPISKREIDMPSLALNEAQRDLFLRLGGTPMPWKP